MNPLAGGHQKRLVIAKGHHQIALARLVEGLEQPLQRGHGIHHPGVIGVEQLGVTLALVRAGAAALLPLIAGAIEGAVPLHGDRIGKQRFVILFAALEQVVDQRIIGDIEPLVLKGGEAGVEPALLIAERRDCLGAAPEFFHIGVGEQGLVAALSGALGQPRHLLREVVVRAPPPA